MNQKTSVLIQNRSDPHWYFAVNSGDIIGINSTQMHNEYSKTQTFVREICQNCLDAHDPDSEQPVEIEFEKIQIDSSCFPDISNYSTTIDECIEESSNLKDNLRSLNCFNSMKGILEKAKVEFLRVGDYNTTGLSGFDPNDIKASWNRLIRGFGISDKRLDQAGSKGVGKNSFYEVSRLRTIFFSTYSKEDRKKATIGRASFMAHRSNGKLMAATGYYGYNEDGVPLPIYERSFVPVFIKDRGSYGTDVYIGGYDFDSEDWVYVIMSAVVKGFFFAIAKCKLVVHVEGNTIDDKSLIRIINECRTHISENDPDLDSLPDIIDAVMNTEPQNPNNENFSIYLKKVDYSGRTITTKEFIGMTMKEHFGSDSKCCGAVVIKNTQQLLSVLNECENITHTDWEPTLIDDTEMRKKAKNIIANMKSELTKCINQLLKREAGDSKQAAGLSSILGIANPEGGEQTPIPVIQGEVSFGETTQRKNKSTTHSSPVGKIRTKVKRVPKDDSPFPPGMQPSPHKIHTTPSGTKLEPDDANGSPMDVDVFGPPEVIRTILNSKGEYVVLIKSHKDTSCIVSVHPCYEDDYGRDSLPIKSAEYDNGALIPVNDDRIGPFDVKSNAITKIQFCLAYPELCNVSVVIR